MELVAVEIGAVDHVSEEATDRHPRARETPRRLDVDTPLWKATQQLDRKLTLDRGLPEGLEQRRVEPVDALGRAPRSERVEGLGPARLRVGRTPGNGRARPVRGEGVGGPGLAALARFVKRPRVDDDRPRTLGASDRGAAWGSPLNALPLPEIAA